MVAFHIVDRLGVPGFMARNMSVSSVHSASICSSHMTSASLSHTRSLMAEEVGAPICKMISLTFAYHIMLSDVKGRGLRSGSER
jgi:hypothetical protein